MQEKASFYLYQMNL